jgi:beta-glucosidase
VQGDNEAILPMVSDHHYYKTLEEAVVGALSAGVVAVDSGANADIIAALASALQDGTATIEQLDAAVSRQFEMRFKVGEFDTNNTNNPFRLEYDESQIDGPAHRALAREAVAKSLILLKNDNQVLPLSSSNPPSSIAVIGPWANVNDTRGDYGCYNTYAGNYATQTSVVSTISDAIAEAVGLKSSVTYALGSNPYTLSSPTGIADSALLASQSEVTVLVLGLGCSIEAEGVDRPNLYLPSVQDELFASVSLAVQNRRAAGQAGVLILVTVSANIADVNEDGADAWIQLMIPGEEAGHGFVDILFGSASPSGRLPLTSYTNDYFNVCGPIADFNMISDTTGIGRTYRFAEYIPQGMIKHHFGFGLSYSSFTYSGLQLVELSDGSINVTFAVANVGSFSPAREVSQVYVQVPQIDGLITPTIQLRGFDVVSLSSGNEPTSVTIQLPFPKAFATTMKNGSSIVTGGEYTVYVSGHQPNDIEGSLQSNVLKGVVRK